MARKKLANSIGLGLDEKYKQLTNPIVTHFRVDPIKIDGVERFCIGAYNAAERCMISVGSFRDVPTLSTDIPEAQWRKKPGLVDIDRAGCGFIFDTRENAQKIIKEITPIWNTWQRKEYKDDDLEIQEEPCKA